MPLAIFSTSVEPAGCSCDACAGSSSSTTVTRTSASSSSLPASSTSMATSSRSLASWASANWIASATVRALISMLFISSSSVVELLTPRFPAAWVWLPNLTPHLSQRLLGSGVAFVELHGARSRIHQRAQDIPEVELRRRLGIHTVRARRGILGRRRREQPAIGRQELQVVRQRPPARDDILLDHRKDAANDPVEYCAGGECKADVGEHQRQDQHRLAHRLLLRILHPWHRHELDDQLEDQREHAQNIERISPAEIGDPEETAIKLRLAEVLRKMSDVYAACGQPRDHRAADMLGDRNLRQIDHRAVDADKDRKLQEDRQTATERVDLVLPVELHLLFLEFLGILAVFALNLFDLRLKHLHLARGLHLFQRKRQDHEACENREENDRQTAIAGPGQECQ